MSLVCIQNARLEETGFNYTMSLIQGKYKMFILYALMEFGTVRFNELKRYIATVSYKTLSVTLKELEAESIYIIREVAAAFENPVMLYSIGKDSSVMARLAEKAFAPGRPPFPLMHIDSKWKFKEMLQFRDAYAKDHGWKLIVESNMEAFKAGVGPFTHG